MAAHSDVNVVVGIRIGTKYTSVAYLFSSDEVSYQSPMWDDPLHGRVSPIQPTIAVYSPDKTLQAFGNDAVKQIQEQNNSNLLVLRNFVKDIFCCSNSVR
jgi:hypothetical protein